MNAPIVVGLVIFGLFAINGVGGFPDGAPADTCVKQRANQPNHGQARSQSLQSNPFELVASAENYSPGQKITVVIYPYDNRHVFRGFFIQARDVVTNEWIGQWEQSENTKTIPECSAITHSDNRDKLGAKLIWQAPQHKKGRVYFTPCPKPCIFCWQDICATSRQSEGHGMVQFLFESIGTGGGVRKVLWLQSTQSYGIFENICLHGTVLQEYGKFWSNIVGTVQSQVKQ